MPFIASTGGVFGYGRSRAAAAAQSGIVQTGLLLYLDAGNTASYPGTGTTWTDLSSNANNATSLTGTTYSSLNGGYLSFNGTTGSGSLDAAKYNTTYTGKTVFIAGNITDITGGTYRAAIGSSAGSRNFNFYFYSPSNGTYALHFSSGGSGGISTNISYTLGTWFTAGCTQQLDGTLIFYFNGQQVNTISSTFFQYQSGSTEHVGRADNFWYGPLPVVCAYSIALTPTQMLTNHNAIWGRYGAPSSGTSLLAAARAMATTFSGLTVAPTSAGALTINSQAVGNYEYTVKGTTTVSSFTAADWFTSTADTVSSWIIVNGDLTINAGQTIIPSVRKLFTVVYVSGNLVVNGAISMTGRGANHSGTGSSGGATTAVAIRIGTGTFSAVVNPEIPAAGGAGGAARSGTDGANNGTAGSAGGSGGGGSGYRFLGGTAGGGSAGTCFTGGTGGGAVISTGTAGNGGANGGVGGQGVPTNSAAITGGTGNPGGNDGTAQAGGVGTGGTLIVIVAGSVSGTGSIVANGVDSNRIGGGAPGGASGGGSATILFGTNPSGPTTLTANGGNGQSGGNGGAGTARKLAIGAN